MNHPHLDQSIWRDMACSDFPEQHSDSAPTQASVLIKSQSTFWKHPVKTCTAYIPERWLALNLIIGFDLDWWACDLNAGLFFFIEMNVVFTKQWTPWSAFTFIYQIIFLSESGMQKKPFKEPKFNNVKNTLRPSSFSEHLWLRVNEYEWAAIQRSCSAKAAKSSSKIQNNWS